MQWRVDLCLRVMSLHLHSNMDFSCSLLRFPEGMQIKQKGKCLFSDALTLVFPSAWREVNSNIDPVNALKGHKTHWFSFPRIFFACNLRENKSFLLKSWAISTSNSSDINIFSWRQQYFCWRKSLYMMMKIIQSVGVINAGFNIKSTHQNLTLTNGLYDSCAYSIYRRHFNQVILTC